MEKKRIAFEKTLLNVMTPMVRHGLDRKPSVCNFLAIVKVPKPGVTSIPATSLAKWNVPIVIFQR